MLPEDRLSVLGTAVGELPPDRVEWTLVVREVDNHASLAFNRCSERLRALAGALAEAELTTGRVNVEEEYHSHGHKLTGRHIATGSLKAASPIDRAGELAATAMNAGADSLFGPRALFPDETGTRDALYGAAVANARATAAGMATAAGRTLGRVVSIRDPRADESDGTVYAMAASGHGGDEDGPPVLTRPQRLSVAVAVVFQLLD
jgi:uncharacterized protein YggE